MDHNPLSRFEAGIAGLAATPLKGTKKPRAGEGAGLWENISRREAGLWNRGVKPLLRDYFLRSAIAAWAAARRATGTR